MENMELIERAGYLTTLQTRFKNIEAAEGHCILLSGESGIGKTSLVRAFCRERKDDCKIYQGYCDAMFTPRPLAPLYDIVSQLGGELWQDSRDIDDRAGLFTSFFNALRWQKETTVIIFEDVHWADEATLDFIKFFARRIASLHCLFILTYRDNEIHSRHPLRSVLGQLPPDSFTRMQLAPLSRQAVEKLAVEKGYSGEDVYSISGGNPFYVNEILASYSPGIPPNIKDSVLAIYNSLDENTKHVWDILSVLPTGFELKYLEKMEPLYAGAIENCMAKKILVPQQGLIFFKHELYRRTVENSLSPLIRAALNKRILELFLESFEQNHETERIVHHAKNANQYELVTQYAPIAAKRAASVGAHIEAGRLYLSAIEYYQGNDKSKLIGFYEAYAYECYLTNQVKEAIIYQGKSLNLWKEKKDGENIGNCMRFLSRLWWYDGNRQQAETYAAQAITVLADHPPSKAKAMAFSNMSQLKMLSNQADECLLWGEKAIEMARGLADKEILAHALNNVGAMKMKSSALREEGISFLQQSLYIALANSYHEHAARAYTNMGSTALELKDFELAKNYLEAGIQYCEERDLDSWTTYMLCCKSRLYLETGNWEEAMQITDSLVKNEDLASIVKIGTFVVAGTIKMRRGEPNALPMIHEAKIKAFETMELQRIIPALAALLEYEWLTGKEVIADADIASTIGMLHRVGGGHDNDELAFWLRKARKQVIPLVECHGGYQLHSHASVLMAASFWGQLGCPYNQALTLFEGNDTDKKNAISIVQKLGAGAVYEKLKMEMRASGIKSIPRGIRKTTLANPAQLTERELDVLTLLKEGLQNKEIGDRLFISPKTVDHHISAILFKLDVNSRTKAVQAAIRMAILK